MGAIRAGIPPRAVVTTSFGNYVVQFAIDGTGDPGYIGEKLSWTRTLRLAWPSPHSSKPLASAFPTTPQNPANDTSGHIIKVEIQDHTKSWRRIIPTQTYSVVTMDFVMTGGDNILVKKPGIEAITLERMDEVLMSYVEAGKCITPYVDGRIRDVGPRMERDYSEMMAMNLKSYLVNREAVS